MAIAVVGGASASLAVAGTSLAFAAAGQTATDITIIAVAILTTTVTVSGISDGTNTGVFRGAINNSTNVRVELWSLPIASSATRTITITFSGSTLASAAYEEYSGSTGIGNIGSGSTGNSQSAQAIVTEQDTSSWVIVANAFASSSGDTLSGVVGTNRQSVIPALTTSGVSLSDVTEVASIPVLTSIWISNARQWAAIGLELRTGVSATSIAAENKVGPSVKSAFNYQVVKSEFLISGSTPVPVAQILQTATVGVAYSETVSAQGGVSPYTYTVTIGALPTGTSLNPSTGVISGTPSTLGTYNFTVKVTDTNGSTGTQAFQITVASPSTGGGGNVCVIY